MMKDMADPVEDQKKIKLAIAPKSTNNLVMTDDIWHNEIQIDKQGKQEIRQPNFAIDQPKVVGEKNWQY